MVGKSVEFTPKDYAIVHYVYAGKGKFEIGDKKYSLSEGDAFLIPPGQTARYEPSPSDPWSYFWIGIGGTNAMVLLNDSSLSESSPVYHDGKKELLKFFSSIHSSYFAKGYFSLDCLGQAYLLLDALNRKKDKSKTSPSEKGHIQEAKEYILNNFQIQITIVDVARSVGVNPNYLANLFAQYGEISPKAFLTEVRMKEAARLLRHSDANIGEVAKAVGYPSPLHFSQSFKSHYGVSPLHYRKKGGNL